jgi:RNA polymerase sigma-70 factor, ECF subfamily
LVADILPFPRSTDRTDPERTMAQRQILDLVEHAADALPPRFRLVFMARIVEGMSVEETAEALGIRPETVKTRLHRARAMLRREIDQQVGPVLLDAFPFLGRRCDRLTEAVLRRLGA